jgi:hypothetical protein
MVVLDVSREDDCVLLKPAGVGEAMLPTTVRANNSAAALRSLAAVLIEHRAPKQAQALLDEAAEQGDPLAKARLLVSLTKSEPQRSRELQTELEDAGEVAVLEQVARALEQIDPTRAENIRNRLRPPP